MHQQHPETEAGAGARRLNDLCSVKIKNAGGQNSRLVLVTQYIPRKGHKKTVYSNHVKYGKSWATRQEITEADKSAFVHWVNTGLANRGVGGSSTRLPPWLVASASRSSARLDQSQAAILRESGQGVALVEDAVLQCVKTLVHMVVKQARYHIVAPLQRSSMNCVPGKRKHDKTDVGAASAVYRPLSMTKRMRAAPRRLTQPKRTSKGFNYRNNKLKRAAAAKAEEDLEWLQVQRHRLATLVARQACVEMLPDGAFAILILMWLSLSFSLTWVLFCCAR